MDDSSQTSLSGYTSPKVENFSIFILSPLHPSGMPYLAKSEISAPVKLVGFDFHRSVQGSVAQRIQGVRGLAVGVWPSVRKRQDMGHAPKVAQPTRSRRAPQDYMKMQFIV